MREITRIHIAKIAYDIELDAKEEVEKYIEALERYASDPEILGDIEIRMTELLAEHGVPAGGVITKEDVAAVRAQLGEPSDFAAEEDGAKAHSESTNEEARRVYRDTDNAIVGGVLSGFARFFNVDPLWIRLLFIAVLLGSFGTALVVYIVLWLVVPPAETAAEKLRMSGRAVTLASIKEVAGSEEGRSERAKAARRTLSVIAGSLLVLIAVAGLLAIIAVVFGIQFGLGAEFAPVTDRWVVESWWFRTMMGLYIVSGLLFSALCFVLASAVFRRQWTKRVGITVVAIITLGLVAFTSGIGVGMYGVTAEQARISELHRNTSGDVPANFKNIKTLTFDTELEGYVPMQYIVSDEPRYELDAFPGVEPRFELSGDGLSATVKLVKTSSTVWYPKGSLGRGMTVLRVYGPALDTVETASSGPAASYYNEAGQAKLNITMRGPRFSLDGKYDTVSVMSNVPGAMVSLEDAVIGELNVEGGRVVAGVVRLLSVNQPDVCAVKDHLSIDHFVHVQGISGGKLIYNGKEEPAKTISNSCGKVIVGDESSAEDEL